MLPLNETIDQPQSRKGRIAYAVFLLIAAATGLLAAFTLTREKIHQLQFPDTGASCDFSLVLQCGKNLASWQGSLFGFPNPLLGLIGWTLIAGTGVALLAGARFARWYWICFNIGAAIALTFVIWLISQSIFVLGTLCPWCMVTWSAVIPLFIVTTLWNLKHGIFGGSETLKFHAGRALTWSPLITLLGYLVVTIVAQLRLDILSYL